MAVQREDVVQTTSQASDVSGPGKARAKDALGWLISWVLLQKMGWGSSRNHGSCQLLVNCWIFDGADWFIYGLFSLFLLVVTVAIPPWYSNFKRPEPLPELKYSKYSGWFPASIYLRRWSGGYCYLKFFEMELLKTWMDGFQLRNDSEGGVKFHRPSFPTPWSEGGGNSEFDFLAIAQSMQWFPSKIMMIMMGFLMFSQST